MNLVTTLRLGAFFFVVTGCATTETAEQDPINDSDTLDDTETSVEDNGSLIEVAASAGDFTTLLAAVDAAGLTETLDQDGPFTVFAPTDAAFNALPEGTVEALLADVPALTDILLFHVVSGNVDSSTVAELSLIETLEGSDIKVTLDGDVYVNNAMVTVVDVAADNGTIHIIDAVIQPPADIVSIAASDDQFSTLVTALEVADLAVTLSGEGPFTVFAPTNAAFDALPEGQLDMLLGDVDALTDILLFHVAGDKLTAADIGGSTYVETLLGVDAEIGVSGESTTIANAPISFTDIPASNGVIHIIDAVMVP